MYTVEVEIYTGEWLEVGPEESYIGAAKSYADIWHPSLASRVKLSGNIITQRTSTSRWQSK